MPGEPHALETAKTALNEQQLTYTQIEEQYVTKLHVQHGVLKASFRVSSKGALDVQGPDSALKAQLQEIKAALESGKRLPGRLPTDIDQLAQTLRERVPNCDPVILAFIDEAIRCFKCDALLACAFLLGAASEKAIGTLVQVFGECMPDATHRGRYETKTNNRMISARFDEFTSRYKNCTSRPNTAPLNQDIDTLLGTAFQFYRMTRNAIGHPDVLPGLDRAVLHGNLAQFVVYMERIYALCDHFRTNRVMF